jgi:betaine-aldehyde dehydrogenase
MPLHARATYLRAIADQLEAKLDEIAGIICAEVGMPLTLSRIVQTELPITVLRSTARIAEQFEFEKIIGHSRVAMDPIGVVAAITPWNYPLHQIVAKVAPALAAGCTVVVKPSELAPINAAMLANACEAAGLPEGVFNLVNGTGPNVGKALASHVDVAMISFTGSTETGRLIAREAGSALKKTSLELGGKSASIVLQDGDLRAAVKATVASCFMNSGQTCSALTRLIVPETRLNEATELAEQAAATFVLGDPRSLGVRMGPVISAGQRERIRDLIKQGTADGAFLVCGGADAPEGLETGYYVKPTVFTGVHSEAALAQEEIFGPVLSIIAASDEDQAIEITNATRYGLAAAVWSAGCATEVASRIHAGQIDVNGARFNPLAPFGGVKDSGYGRELGEFGIHEFLVTRSVQWPG